MSLGVISALLVDYQIPYVLCYFSGAQHQKRLILFQELNFLTNFWLNIKLVEFLKDSYKYLHNWIETRLHLFANIIQSLCEQPPHCV